MKRAVTEKYCASVIPQKDASIYRCLASESIQAMVDFFS